MLNVLANLRKYVVEARGCAKKSLDRKYLIKHHPFDKAKVYRTGSIHHTYEINIYKQ